MEGREGPCKKIYAHAIRVEDIVFLDSAARPKVDVHLGSLPPLL
jgi:hypothetical protein